MRAVTLLHMPKLAPAIRIGLTLLGVVMVLAAFLGVLYLGVGTNPPPLRIAVAVRDIAQGSALAADDYRVVDQIIDPRLAQMYVQESELAAFQDAYVVETLRKGDPINKVKLATGDTAGKRYALALKDPNDVVMSLPVGADVLPPLIAPGDFVNILLAGGSEAGMSRLPQPTAVPDLAVGAELSDTLAAFGQSSLIADAIELPLADLMLEHVQVLDVVRRTEPQGNSDEQRAAGPILSLVVKVPRSHQTLLMFGASTSKLRFAIASPAHNARAAQPQIGMDWAKYIAIYRWKESQVLARGETLTQTLFPALAYSQTVTLPQGRTP